MVKLLLRSKGEFHSDKLEKKNELSPLENENLTTLQWPGSAVHLHSLNPRTPRFTVELKKM